MSLNCKISRGVSAACETTVAGVLRLAIANYDEGFTFTQSSGSCEIDTIDLLTEKAYELDIADGSGVATATGTIGANGSSKYYVHTVSGLIQKLNCDVLGEYNNFFLGKFVVFAELRDHSVLAFGVGNGLTASVWEFTSGTAEGDATGVSFTFDGSESEPPLKISSWSVVRGLMA